MRLPRSGGDLLAAPATPATSLPLHHLKSPFDPAVRVSPPRCKVLDRSRTSSLNTRRLPSPETRSAKRFLTHCLRREWPASDCPRPTRGTDPATHFQPPSFFQPRALSQRPLIPS